MGLVLIWIFIIAIAFVFARANLKIKYYINDSQALAPAFNTDAPLSEGLQTTSRPGLLPVYRGLKSIYPAKLAAHNIPGR